MAKVLTQVSIDKLGPGTARREIPDGHTHGLFLVLQPTGKKGWAVRYRHQGRSRKYTIGDYPAIGLKDACVAASRVLIAIAEGQALAPKSRPPKPLQGLQDARRATRLKRSLMISSGSTQSRTLEIGKRLLDF
jgi:Arm DNA-binding domain